MAIEEERHKSLGAPLYSVFIVEDKRFVIERIA
jgi:hypothetical protein